jgi:DNA-binding NarL/FixJ family response regulator
VLLADEPAWPTFLEEVRAFLGSPTIPAPRARPTELSSREEQVLELVAQGLRNEQIAGRLYLSTRTVERHLSNIYAKLRISGKAARAAAAARYAQCASVS